MPAIRLSPGKLTVVPHGRIRFTEFARHYMVPWAFLGDGTVLHEKYGRVRLAVTGGGPKVQWNNGRWGVGFGTTFGTSASDCLGGLKHRTAYTKYRSMFTHYYRNALGGAGLGRTFQKTGDSGFLPESLYHSTAYKILYNREQTSGGNGQWGLPGSATVPQEERYGFRHDQVPGTGGYGNTPLFMENGVIAAGNNAQNSLGDLLNVDDVVIEFGNRSTDLQRNFDGLLYFVVPFDGDIGWKNLRDMHENPVRMIIEREPIMVPMFSTAPTARMFSPARLDGLGSGGGLLGPRLQ